VRHEQSSQIRISVSCTNGASPPKLRRGRSSVLRGLLVACSVLLLCGLASADGRLIRRKRRMRMRHTQDHVYRTRSQSFGIVLTVLVGDLFLATFIARTSEPGAIGIIAVFILVGTVIGLRAALTAVEVSREGVQVINVFKKFGLSWADIELFEIGQSGFLPQVCLIRTKDGNISHAFGIQERNTSLLQSQDTRPAMKIVAELNRELAAHTRPQDTTQTQ
jgi:hypothetical protein